MAAGVSAQSRRRVVGGVVSAAAAAVALYAAIDPQIGSDDFRLSDMGADGDPTLDAERPAVAYNDSMGDFLVVWQGENTTDNAEIWGQRVEGGSGTELGADFRISTMGDQPGPSFSAEDPAVAYNSVQNEYLVVWQGNNTLDDVEIWGQRLNAATGAQIGDDFRISTMGPNGESRFDGEDPAVAYNPTVDEYLVVWEGDDDRGTQVNGEFEIFGQRIDGATGSQVGSDDFRISHQGPDGDNDFDAGNPAIAYNSVDDEYLVVWEGDAPGGALKDEEFEIYGQRLNAANGNLLGADFRISQQKGTGNARCDAEDAAVAYSPMQNSYLVVWRGDDYCEIDGTETEIFGQRVSAAGAELGGDFRISDTGPANEVFDPYDAENPAVAWFGDNDEFFVAWDADDDDAPLVDDEFEIYGLRVDAASGATVVEAQRLSSAGEDGDAAFNAERPAVAWDSAIAELLIAWQADDNTGSLVDGEREIYGQRVAPNAGPDLELSALVVACGAGDGLDVSVTVDNLGLLPAGPFEIGVYASLGPDIDPDGDLRLGSITLPGGLAAGSFEMTAVTLDTSAVTAGTYFIGVVADDLEAVEETTESNNQLSTAASLSLPCSGAPCSLADADLTLANQTLSGVSSFEACFTIHLGPGLTLSSTADVTARAGQGIVFENGVSLESGAELAVEIDPGLRSLGPSQRARARPVRRR